MKSNDLRIIAVIGAGECNSSQADVAREVGRLLAVAGCVLVTGGLGGVMAAASEGASSAGGTVVGILPGTDPGAANPWVDIPIATGMGDARNAILCNTAEAFIAVGGSFGTLSEIAFALKRGKPVVSLDSFRPDDRVRPAASPAEALEILGIG
ncbi:MAG: TIGR00725 family protein [Planctomycetota bacterium]